MYRLTSSLTGPEAFLQMGHTPALSADRGRLEQLTQDKWNVDYQSYKTIAGSGKPLTLPARLLISALPGTIEVYSKKGKYLGDELEVKVILKRWWNIELDQSLASN